MSLNKTQQLNFRNLKYDDYESAAQNFQTTQCIIERKLSGVSIPNPQENETDETEEIEQKPLILNNIDI